MEGEALDLPVRDGEVRPVSERVEELDVEPECCLGAPLGRRNTY